MGRDKWRLVLDRSLVLTDSCSGQSLSDLASWIREVRRCRQRRIDPLSHRGVADRVPPVDQALLIDRLQTKTGVDVARWFVCPGSEGCGRDDPPERCPAPDRLLPIVSIVQRPSLLAWSRVAWVVDGRPLDQNAQLVAWQARDPGEHTIQLVHDDGDGRTTASTR